MKVKTFTATIYVGLKHGYSGEELPTQPVIDYIQKWVDDLGMCVTVTPTNYIYSKGHESGLIVGFINYPRFPCDEFKMKNNALDLASGLMQFCKQMRVSVVFPDETIMLSNDPEIDKNTAK